MRTILATAAGVALAGSAWTATAAAFDYDAFLKSMRLPADFSIVPAAGEPTIRFPMFACLDDDGRLYVTESSGRDLYAGLKHLTRDCQVSRLEDADGDGRFEKATVFQKGVTFPMGIAWHAGRLYVADPPDLIALSDLDGDGRADKREVILSGFGHTDNGSLHGLTFGPDGLLYFTMGEPDGWKLPRGDGSFLEGSAGALFRCQPDGSRPEVVSRGFENLVEIEFMPGGEFIGTDNWYQKPSGGFRDALIDCAPGGLYPYAPDRGTPLPRTGITLPPLILLPAVAHSGLTRLRAGGFPGEWRDSLFVAEHNTRKVVRHDIRRHGSTFASSSMDFAVGDHPDFHPSDVLEDADGSLLIVDTGGWYVEHCPTGRIRDSRAPGGIYRVRWNHAPGISDPHGRRGTGSDPTPSMLAEELRDGRPRLADRAADALLQRGDLASLAAALGSRERIDVRLRALWALGRSSDATALAAVRQQLALSDPTLVTAAARVLASRRSKESGDALASLLNSTNAAVRRAAVEALAVCGSRSHAPGLVAALSAAGDDFEQHACIHALLSLADEPFVRGLLSNPSPRVRRAALHLLDQPPFNTLGFDDLVGPLGDPDPPTSDAARRLLQGHRNWSTNALPWLRGQLDSLSSDGLERSAPGGLIVAFQSDPAVRDLISGLLDPGATTSEATRAFLLTLVPTLTAREPESAWLAAVTPALTNAALRGAALGVAAAHPRPEWTSTLGQLADNPGIPVVQRLFAARISARQPALSDRVFDLAVGSLDSRTPAPDRLGAVDLLTHARLSPQQARRLVQTLQRPGAMAVDAFLPALVESSDDDTRTLLMDLIATRLKEGWSPARSTLDPALALLPADSPVRASLIMAWEGNNSGRLRRLAEWQPLLKGGDSARGREWFSLATCAGCHRIGDSGGVIGPDLTKIGAIRSGGDLLESILFPSSSFAQGFEPYQLVRRDGEELSGSLVRQGPEGVTLRDGAGTLHHFRPAEVASLERRELSAMPEGLEQLLTHEQFRDLLAFLQELR